ncbi:hypothetical protein D3C87_905780 [compost metagenome]
MKNVVFYASLGVFVLVAVLCLFGCGGGGDDEAPGVENEVPKYHVPATPDPCTTTYPCQPK